MTTVRAIVGFSGVLLALALPHESGAQCLTSADAKVLKKHLRLTARCNDRMLKSGTDVVCTPAPPAPACAGTLATDALALAYGDNNPPAARVDASVLGLHLKCQKRIGKAVTIYAFRKLRAL